jgi:hypothetical protein
MLFAIFTDGVWLRQRLNGLSGYFDFNCGGIVAGPKSLRLNHRTAGLIGNPVVV